MTDNVGMRKFLAIAALGLTACAPAIAQAPVEAPTTTTIAPTTTTTIPAAHEALVAEALAAFEGMELPPLRFEFPETCAENAKGWHSHRDGVSTIKACDVSLHTLTHEIAHAWEEINLTDAQRDELLDRWGLEYWENYDEAPWLKNGAERLALAFTWSNLGEAPPMMGTPRALEEWQDVLEVIGQAPAPANAN